MRTATSHVLLLLVGVAACGSGARGSRPASDAHFRRIQAEEATLIEQRTRAAEGTCEKAPAAARGACRAAERVCAVANDVDDADARTRCRRARESCAATRAGVASRCGSGEPP